MTEEKSKGTWAETWGKLDWVNTPDEELCEQVEKLKQMKADIMATDINGDTPLHHASFGGKPMTVQKLITADTINAVDNQNCTPLHAAALSMNSDIAPILIAAGAKVNAVNGNGITPLDLAYFYGRFKTVKRLYDAGGVGAKVVSNDKLNAMMGAYSLLESLGKNEIEIISCLDWPRLAIQQKPKKVAKRKGNTKKSDGKQKQRS